jgi:hypothetical protein
MEVLDSFTPDELLAKYRKKKRDMKKRLKRRRSN